MGKPSFNRLRDKDGKKIKDSPIGSYQKYGKVDGATHYGYGAGKFGLFKSHYPEDYKGKKRTFLRIRDGFYFSLPEYAQRPSGHWYGRPLWTPEGESRFS